MSFNENDVNREQDGRFGEKVGSAPTFILPDQRPMQPEAQQGVWGGAGFPEEPVVTPYSAPGVESIITYEDDTDANRQFDVSRDEAADDAYYGERQEADFITRTQARLLLWRGRIDKRYQRDAITAASYGREVNGTTANPRAALLGAVMEAELHRDKGALRPFGGADIQEAQESLAVLDTKMGERYSFEDVHRVASAATDIESVRIASSSEMRKELADLYRAWFKREDEVSAKAVSRSVRENGVRGTTELLQG